MKKNNGNMKDDTGMKAFFRFIFDRMRLDPLTQKRIARFKQITRARLSFSILMGTLVFALFAEVFINKRPLVMSVDGRLYFPVYGKMRYCKDFDYSDKSASELNYRDFKKFLKETKRGWLIMPPVPYDAFEIDVAEAPLSLSFSGCPVLGLAIDKKDSNVSDDRVDYIWVDVGDVDGVKVSEDAEGGKRFVWIKYSNTDKSDAANAALSDFPSKDKAYIGLAWNKKSRMESDIHSDYTWMKLGVNNNILVQPNGSITWVRYAKGSKGEMYHPLPPSFKNRHILGTDRIGRDIFARLVYGYRYAMAFSLVVVAITFVIGIAVGVLMGYHGGLFDTITQRFIEIWEQIPFLYMVMILSAIFKPSLGIFVFIFVIFSWTSKTWTARAMTYRERERDYILAAKSMGASTWRIVWVHIVPNIIVIILTSLPFAVSGGISSLTSLDFLGYGLPPPTPSWGELLSVGISTYKEAPWILSSITTSMVIILVMITFIGEGLRDAFDPRRYTVYK